MTNRLQGTVFIWLGFDGLGIIMRGIWELAVLFILWEVFLFSWNRKSIFDSMRSIEQNVNVIQKSMRSLSKTAFLNRRFDMQRFSTRYFAAQERELDVLIKQWHYWSTLQGCTARLFLKQSYSQDSTPTFDTNIFL